MNKKAQFEFEMDQENIVSIILAVVAGIVSLIVTKSTDVGIFWKIATFVSTAIVSYILVRFIGSK